MFRRSMLALAGLAALALFAVWLSLGSGPEAVPLDAGERAPEESSVVVYVSGAVIRPGVVKLAGSDRVEQAVAACGGALPQADLTNINLAQPLSDGMQVRVPERADAGGSAAVREAADERVHINAADAKTLETLPGVGPVTAKRIVEYRAAHGPFQSVEELKKVRGIGEAKLARIKEKAAL